MSTEFHETKERLIATTVELIESMPLENISTAIILEKSGVSKGSMYHFFDDFSDLLDAAYGRRFAHRVNVSADYIQKIIDESNSADEFFNALELLTIRTQDRSNASLRFDRARMLARAERNERFRKILGDIQQELTDRITASIEIGQQKGWITKKYEARTMAVFIQAYTIGRLVDEIVPNPMNDTDWDNMIHDMSRQLFGNFKAN